MYVILFLIPNMCYTPYHISWYEYFLRVCVLSVLLMALGVHFYLYSLVVWVFLRGLLFLMPCVRELFSKRGPKFPFFSVFSVFFFFYFCFFFLFSFFAAIGFKFFLYKKKRKKWEKKSINRFSFCCTDTLACSDWIFIVCHTIG